MAHKTPFSLSVPLFVIIALMITACVVPAAPAAQTASEGAGRILHVLSEEISPESQAFYRQAAADFEKANPGVTVSLDFPSNADALAIRVAAGEPPEISTMQLEQQLYYADQGMLEPATWWFDKHGDDVVDLASVPYNDVYVPPEMADVIDSVRPMIAAAQAASTENFLQGESRRWRAYRAVGGVWSADVWQPAVGIVHQPLEISLRQVVQMCLCLSGATDEVVRQTRQGTVLQSVVLLEQLRDSTWTFGNGCVPPGGTSTL